jgi:hypothetical protein
MFSPPILWSIRATLPRLQRRDCLLNHRSKCFALLLSAQESSKVCAGGNSSSASTENPVSGRLPISVTFTFLAA